MNTPVDFNRTDSDRLEWMLANRNFRVQGSDEKQSWCVLDCSNGLTFLTKKHKTARDAIDAAMKIQKEML